MDVISHALIGEIIYLLSGGTTATNFLIILFAVIADIVHIPFYLILGKKNSRRFCIAKKQDWEGASVKYKFFTFLYNTTHSLFFTFLVISPVIIFFKLSIWCFLAYLSHIIVDIFTHKGEWAIKIFWPFKFKINGLSNAWIWPIEKMANYWIIFSAIIIFLSFFSLK
jgi:membrane-bound metal-dependent hydrolase YbcI (DUF457 family)